LHFVGRRLNQSPVAFLDGGESMSFEDRIESLRLKHQSLEDELKAESQRPSPDVNAITRLKREKLKLKDEITRLGQHLPA
jgi:hypothetical protein